MAPKRGHSGIPEQDPKMGSRVSLPLPRSRDVTCCRVTAPSLLWEGSPRRSKSSAHRDDRWGAPDGCVGLGQLDDLSAAHDPRGNRCELHGPRPLCGGGWSNTHLHGRGYRNGVARTDRSLSVNDLLRCTQRRVSTLPECLYRWNRRKLVIHIGRMSNVIRSVPGCQQCLACPLGLDSPARVRRWAIA